MANAVIQKAFNAGYLIEKYLPKFSKLLVKGFKDKTNPYAEAFIAGSQEFEREQMKSLPSPLTKFIHKRNETPQKELPEHSKDVPEDDLEL